LNDLLQFARIFNIIAPILILGGIGFFIYVLKFKRTSKYKVKEEKSINVKSIKRKSINFFNLIDDFKGRFVITNNKKKYTAGIVASGVPIDKLSPTETKIIENNFISLFSMLEWEAQMYIQSTRMDVDDCIEDIEKQIKELEQEKKEILKNKSRILKLSGENPRMAQENKETIIEIERQIKALNFRYIHKNEELAYAKAVAAPTSKPTFKPYILFTFEYNPSDYSTKLTDEEIFKKADDEITTKLNNTKEIFRKCLVDCDLMGTQKIAELLYRGYNLSDADLIKFKTYFETSAFDLYTSTDYYKKKNAEQIQENLNVILNTRDDFLGGK